MKIIVIINFARSGGTILAQLLNTFEGAWVLSEINPVAGATPDHRAANPEMAIAQQAATWYGVQLKCHGMLETISELTGVANSQGKVLVIRDWSYQNFRKTKQNHFKPSYRLELLEVLRKEFDVQVFAFVRDAVDVFLSVGGDVREFGRDYNSYAQRLISEDLSILKYEDLVANPQQFEAVLAKQTGIAWKFELLGYRSAFATGDLQLGKISRGARREKIEVLPRKRVSRSLISQIQGSRALMEANLLLGYPDTYWNGSVEGVMGMVRRRTANVSQRYWKKLVRR